jgi:hypothetical protein
VNVGCVVGRWDGMSLGETESVWRVNDRVREASRDCCCYLISLEM